MNQNFECREEVHFIPLRKPVKRIYNIVEFLKVMVECFVSHVNGKLMCFQLLRELETIYKMVLDR